MTDPASFGPAWLFCPADRPARFAKAGACADVVIVDLEDGVAPADRMRARANLRAAADELDPATTIVRISAAGSPDWAEDLAAIADTAFTTVMLSKAASAADVDATGPLDVIALCETPTGVLDAAAVAAATRCTGLMWGSEDLASAVGGWSSRDVDGRLRPVGAHARVSVLLAAASARRFAVDTVYIAIDNEDGLYAEALSAAESGYAAKACIHPNQVATVRRAFAPTAEQRRRSQEIVDAAATVGSGVLVLDGRMIDEPVVRQARVVLARAAGRRPSAT